jgi:hypothetical protein
MKCTGCGKSAEYSILLSEGSHGNANKEIRYYIPNQAVREESKKHKQLISEVWFCRKCMRVIEDNFRATVLYLQVESGILTPVKEIK